MPTFSSTDQVRAYQAIAIRNGLKFYAKTKRQPNRDWTPTRMLKAASIITGKTYKRGQYLEAARDIGEKYGVLNESDRSA